MRGDLVGIGDNSVDDFESIAVGLVLEVAAHGVEDGSREKCQQGNQKYQGGERGPILQIANRPASAASGEHPVCQPESQIKQEQNDGGVDGNFLRDVEQNVVAHLMPENEER